MKIQQKIIMLSTTKMLSEIQEEFKRSKSLQSYLPSLITTLQSQKKVVFSNMNAKQKLTQIQQLIQQELKNINKRLTEINIDLDEIEDSPNHLNDKDLQNEDNLQSNQQENQIQQEEESIEADDKGFQQQSEDFDKKLMDEQYEKEFPEPQFTKTKRGKKNYHVMQDQQQQNQANQQEQLQQQGEDQVKDQEYQGEDEEYQDEAGQSENDIGLYGEQLNQNDEDIEDYENQFDEQQFKEFEQEFGEKEKSKKDKKKINIQDQQNPDDYIQDNFDHFREVQMENQQQEVETKQKTQLDNQIDRLEGKVVAKKDWAMKGQVKARERPTNSLLEYDLQFNSGIKYSHQITEQKNTELQELIKKRILSDMFDDRTRFINTSHIREHFGSLKEVSREKNKMGLGQLYQSQFKNFLGIGENKNEKLKSEIMDSFKELNYYLDSLSNFSFVPKPTKETTKKVQSEAIVVEEKVPLTLWNGQRQALKEGKFAFESEKQVDRQAKRLKNKRIARQRKKEQIKKKLNKVIQYGGITKFEAQAKKKAQMNNKPLKIDGVNMKYNKSSSFFKNINQKKGGKPNPDISKMKI